MVQSATTSFLVNGLSDDLLGDILLFNDFETAARFRLVNKAVWQRLASSSPNSSLHKVWRLMYDRQYFAPVEQSFGGVDYFTEIRQRRRLLFQLLQKKKKSKHNRCFSLPNRCFHFKPVLPDGFAEEDDDEKAYPDANTALHRSMVDPPPVIYECDSFVLTSGGTGDELLFLDPFDGSLSVISNFASSCIASDEAVMERAMFHAADAISAKPRSRHFQDWKENEIAGHCFEETFNQNQACLQPSPRQELLSADDYMTFDIGPYFPEYEADPNTLVNEEFDMAFVGIDSKPIMDIKTKTLKGTMVAVARTVTNFQDEFMACSEITTWTKHGMGKYGNRMVCRFPWSFGTVDFDSVQKRLFVSVDRNSAQETPFNKRTVVVYPMAEWTGDDQECFNTPTTTIQCGSNISYLMSDVSGDLLVVGTSGGTVEIWDASKRYKRLANLNIRSRLRSAIEAYVSSKSMKSHLEIPSGDASGSSLTSSLPEAHVAVLRQQPSLRVFQQPVQAVYIPRHLKADQAGFVTFQYHDEEGSNLLLWRPHRESDAFNVVSRINLSLHSRRKPCVLFDGNRLIVFGEDHIGPIILIYSISNGDSHFSKDPRVGEQSGGVYNFTNPPQIRFANRIRHAALGGIHKDDPLFMTTNERFIIVNTKTGNLLDGALSPFSEGLLVIDLQDQCEDRLDFSQCLCTSPAIVERFCIEPPLS